MKIGISEGHHSRPGCRKPPTDDMPALCLEEPRAPRWKVAALQDGTGTPVTPGGESHTGCGFDLMCQGESSIVSAKELWLTVSPVLMTITDP